MRSPVSAALVCFLALTLAACRSRSAAPEDAAVEPLGVTLEVARLQTLRATVTGQGTVKPAAAADWTIYPSDTGRIIELPKAEGDAVSRGDLLVRFDYGTLAAEASARQIEVSSAAGQLDAANRQLAKISAMYDRGYSARKELEAAKASVADAEIQLARAKDQLQAATASAERASIKARFDGVVAKRFHAEGDLVNNSTNDPVLRIVDPARAEVAVSVPVQDLTQIQPGQPATIVSPQGSEPATVLLRPTPTDPRAATQEIRLAFASPTTLPLDSPVGVEILISERPNVIALPAAAVLRDEDGRAFVMIAGVDSRAHRRDVRVGTTTRDRTEITAGVTAGDRVIVKNAASVAEGTLLADK